MEQKTEGAWFYSQAGQQKGPASFAELQAKIAAKELHPGKDLVWKEGMANWTLVRDMGDVFDLNAPPATQAAPAPSPAPSPTPTAPAAKTQPAPQSKAEAAPSPQPAAAPTSQPKAEPKPAPKPDVKPVVKQALEAPTTKKDSKATKQQDYPGARRRHYIFGVCLFPVIWIVLFFFGLSVVGATLGATVAGLLAAVGSLVPAVVSIIVTLKRFTNLAMSRWWIFGFLVPFLNLWVGYRLFACPAGYGAGEKMDGKGIVLAILYWLSLIALVASIPIMMVIAVTTLIDNPDIIQDPERKKQLNELLIQLRDLIKQM